MPAKGVTGRQEQREKDLNRILKGKGTQTQLFIWLLRALEDSDLSDAQRARYEMVLKSKCTESRPMMNNGDAPYEEKAKTDPNLFA